MNDIAEVTGQLRSIVPEANIAFAHGKMDERQLEDVMSDFINGNVDVLVSTTIIETGIDIPNVNTMIVSDADKMGLSQLYQLRGRVGRSNRTSYAFLMYRRGRLLKEEAEKRLAAIREFSELGSGFKIAMKDLEIRGAGNLLGSEQHGHMEAVGYDLYCKMLDMAIKQERGEKVEPDFTTVIDINIDAFIPSEYVRYETLKLDLYKRIARIETAIEAQDMLDELEDRFGKVPSSVKNLVDVALLRHRAHEVYIENVSLKDGSLVFNIFERAALNPTAIAPLLDKFDGALTFKSAGSSVFTYRLGKGERAALTEAAAKVLDEMRILI